MGALHGIVHIVNYWDFASCLEDLPIFLEDVLKCTYIPTVTRKPLNLSTSKDVGFTTVYKIFKEKMGKSILDTLKINVNKAYELELMVPSIVRPIKGEVPKFNCKDVIKFIEFYKNKFDWSRFYERSGLIISNPQCLQQLDLDTAIKFYNIMKNQQVVHLLPRLVKFDYKVHKNYPFALNKVHPFQTTLKD